ncbi:hypothetical protein GA0070216_11720 [Micromonospora matsumotoense]|uniref:Lipoprotein n=1 Tax=Micromonospora matsumotoense TaxID=121616 RepID=A0A1C5AGH7_9ACTN|nr:hypothetical protein [Micromonospora matsumotoense]SCF44300.1 hypothetical protein GA0070216_11720 [Micromonospora matsumotoense]
MKHPKLAAATAALVVLVTAAGCTSDGGAGSTPTAGPSASGPAPTAPTAVLAAAAQRVDQQSYRLSLGDGAGGDGTTLVWDPRARRGLETTTLAVANGKVVIERLATGTDVYVKVTAPDRRVPVWDGRTWWHLGTAEAAAAKRTGLDNTRLASTLGAATEVRATGDRAYAGTLDLRRNTEVLGDGLGGVLGERAAAVPFTATVDAQGRLVRYRIELSGEPGKTSALDLTYADFGLPVSAEKPAAGLIGEDPPGNIPGA